LTWFSVYPLSERTVRKDTLDEQRACLATRLAMLLEAHSGMHFPQNIRAWFGNFLQASSDFISFVVTTSLRSSVLCQLGIFVPAYSTTSSLGPPINNECPTAILVGFLSRSETGASVKAMNRACSA
ncbi:unnamed protein product, partial [Phaeothamnion confervicola]